MEKIVLPGKWNLHELTDLPYYKNWDKGLEAEQYVNNMYKKSSNQRKIYALLIIMDIILFFNTFSFFPVIVFIVLLVLYSKANKLIEEADNVRTKTIQEYKRMIIDATVEKVGFNGFKWRTDGDVSTAFIYNSQMFAFINFYSNFIVAYNKSNIKEIRRDRILIGASTQGESTTHGGAYHLENSNVSAGTARSNTNSYTHNHYEWHLEVFTDYDVHPKVLYIEPDSPQGSEFTGEAYAVLKP